MKYFSVMHADCTAQWQESFPQETLTYTYMFYSEIYTNHGLCKKNLRIQFSFINSIITMDSEAIPMRMYSQ